MKIATAIRATVFTALLASFTLAFAQDPAPQQPPADNSKVNQRDQSPSQPTADQQKNAPNDREMARQIRKALVDDKSLSTYAHNIKVVVQNGQVTLRGPVRIRRRETQCRSRCNRSSRSRQSYQRTRNRAPEITNTAIQ